MSEVSEIQATEWVDDRALERFTPIKRVTWQVWRSRGEGPPFYRVGRRCLYRLDEVRAWLSAQRVGGNATARKAAP